MKNIIISSNELNKALSKFSSLLTGRLNVPICESLLFDVMGSTIEITGTDLQNTLQTSLEGQGDSDDFSFAVDFKTLLASLKTIKNKELEFVFDEGKLQLKFDGVVLNFPTEDVTTFPKVPKLKGPSVYPVTSEQLKDVFDKNLPFVSKDDLRPAMTGVNFELCEKGLTEVCSTDGHRLNVVSFNKDEQMTASCIVPAKVIKISKGISEVQVLEIDKGYAKLRSGNDVLTFRLIDERFPDYRCAIPKDSHCLMTINSENFTNAIKRVLPAANKHTSQIRLKPSSGNLVLHTECLDMSTEANDNVNCLYEGDLEEIGFNGKFLLEFFSKQKGDVVMKMSRANRAATIEKDNQFFLLMPVMLSNYA